MAKITKTRFTAMAMTVGLAVSGCSGELIRPQYPAEADKRAVTTGHVGYTVLNKSVNRFAGLISDCHDHIEPKTGELINISKAEAEQNYPKLKEYICRLNTKMGIQFYGEAGPSAGDSTSANSLVTLNDLTEFENKNIHLQDCEVTAKPGMSKFDIRQPQEVPKLISDRIFCLMDKNVFLEMG